MVRLDTRAAVLLRGVALFGSKARGGLKRLFSLA
jgi:hypothetical protein